MHLIFRTGSLFKSNADILINPVNTVGVMGAGLALDFKKRYPKMFESYKAYCHPKMTLREYKFHVFDEGDPIIYNFASKEHFKKPSLLKYIRYSMVQLCNWLNNHPERDRIKTIAMPPVGAGLGGLEQIQVLHQIYYHLRNLEFEVTIMLYGFDKINKPMRRMFSEQYVCEPIHKRYTGVGSRKTTELGEERIYRVVKALIRKEYLLATGDAPLGADVYFWDRVPFGYKERFGPNGRRYYKEHTKVVKPESDAYALARIIASKNHPAWNYLKEEFHKELHIRNVFQVLGEHLDTPSEYLLCWTPDGAETKTKKTTGGTGTAIRIANSFGIPVFNLCNDDALERLTDYLGVINPI